MKFVDDKSKNLHWWNRNYLFLGTILIVAINILIFAFVNKNPWDIVGIKNNESYWSDIFYFKTTFSLFLSSFFHSNWQHVLLNMLCFFVAGIYLERKQGTFGIILYVLFSAYISAIAIGANSLSIYSVGFSGVNYFIYAIIIIDFLFSFQKHRRNKANIILGSFVVALIYLAMCFNGGTTEFSFSVLPYDLMHNMAHYTSFLAGIIIGLFTETIKLTSSKKEIVVNNAHPITSQNDMMTEKTFLTNCHHMAKQLIDKGKSFTISELVHKIIQDENYAEKWVKSYAYSIYIALKEDIKKGNLDAKILLLKRGEDIIYEKIQFVKK